MYWAFKTHMRYKTHFIKSSQTLAHRHTTVPVPTFHFVELRLRVDLVRRNRKADVLEELDGVDDVLAVGLASRDRA